MIRGDDHLNNTPRQINMLRALGATPPVYAHLPMILGAGRSQALEAPRRGERAAVPRSGFPARRRCSTTSRASAGRTATRRSSRSRR